MILTLVILYALGAFLTMIYVAANINLDGGSSSNPEWGPFSTWLWNNSRTGGFVGGIIPSLNSLLWPITLPLFILKK